nr:MAG TPA: hypothetical protein [Caudoviricetes sp.]
MLGFVFLRCCTNRKQMCKNRLYFAVKCPFCSQNRLIIKQLQAKHPTPPTFEELTPYPAYSQNFLFFYFTSMLYFLCVKISYFVCFLRGFRH